MWPVKKMLKIERNDVLKDHHEDLDQKDKDAKDHRQVQEDMDAKDYHQVQKDKEAKDHRRVQDDKDAKDHHQGQKDKDTKDHHRVQKDKDAKVHRRVQEEKDAGQGYAKHHRRVQKDKDGDEHKENKLEKKFVQILDFESYSLHTHVVHTSPFLYNLGKQYLGFNNDVCTIPDQLDNFVCFKSCD